MKRHLWGVLLAVGMVLAALPGAALAAREPAVSDNQDRLSYFDWSSTVKSYLYDNGSGLTRVEYIAADGAVAVEEYSPDFQLLDGRTLEAELPLWGGFFAGEEYNFLIFGQENTEEDDNKEVIRVVKYSKDWKRLGQASLRGINTVVPFNAGSLRCAEYGGVLYVRTCHKLYTSDDGLNHQANLPFCVREKDMKVTDAFYDVFNVSNGFVSHSFNQFVLVDRDGAIVALDHGDAYPRSLELIRYPAKAGGDTFIPDYYDFYAPRVTHVSVVTFPNYADRHYNYTGASVGGLAETGKGYVTAFSWDGGDDSPWMPYLAFVPKGFDGDTEAVRVKLQDGGQACKTPVLAPTGPQGGWVLWTGDAYKGTGVSYVSYSADGTVGQVRRAGTAALSDCQPIPYGDGVVWYVTKNGAPVFFTLDDSGIQSHGVPAVEGASSWAAEEVSRAAYAGLIPAGLDGNYQDDITRKEFCQLVVRLVEARSGMLADTFISARGLSFQETLFRDVYDGNVTRAYILGIVTGTSETTFSPDNSITRQEAATMLARAARLLGIEAGEPMDFADADDIAPWAAENVELVSGLVDAETGKAVMGGTGAGSFSPLDTYTREQAYLTALRMLLCR